MKYFIANGNILGIGGFDALFSVEDSLFEENDYYTIEELLAREYMRLRCNPRKQRNPGSREMQRPYAVAILYAYEVSEDFVTEFGSRWSNITLSGD